MLYKINFLKIINIFIFFRYKCPALQGLSITISQLMRNDREILRKTIENHGGIYSPSLDMESTTLGSSINNVDFFPLCVDFDPFSTHFSFHHFTKKSCHSGIEKLNHLFIENIAELVPRTMDAQ